MQASAGRHVGRFVHQRQPRCTGSLQRVNARGRLCWGTGGGRGESVSERDENARAIGRDYDETRWKLWTKFSRRECISRPYTRKLRMQFETRQKGREGPTFVGIWIVGDLAGCVARCSSYNVSFLCESNDIRRRVFRVHAQSMSETEVARWREER